MYLKTYETINSCYGYPSWSETKFVLYKTLEDLANAPYERSQRIYNCELLDPEVIEKKIKEIKNRNIQESLIKQKNLKMVQYLQLKKELFGEE